MANALGQIDGNLLTTFKVMVKKLLTYFFVDTVYRPKYRNRKNRSELDVISVSRREQEAQLMLTTVSTRLAVNQGQQS